MFENATAWRKVCYVWVSVRRNFMNKYYLSLIPALALSLMLSGCRADEITYKDTVINCKEFNADIAVLQTLTGELLSGSCVMSVSDNTITFDTGTVASVTVRDTYGFDYANPVVGVSGRYWVVNGTALETKVADALLQFKCEDASWYYSLDSGSNWFFISDAKESTTIPVFTSMTDNGSEVVIALGSGNTFSFDYYEEDD